MDRIFSERVRLNALPPQAGPLDGKRGVRGVCVFDIDDTLVDNSWRDEQARRFGINDWLLGYFSPETLRHDRVIPSAVQACRILAGFYEIIYVTNRAENTRKETRRFLQGNGYPDGRLIMHPDTIIFDSGFKPKAIKRLLSEERKDIKIIYDDEESYIKIYHRMGLNAYWVKDFSVWDEILKNLGTARFKDDVSPVYRIDNYILGRKHLYDGMSAMQEYRALHPVLSAKEIAHAKGYTVSDEAIEDILRQQKAANAIPVRVLIDDAITAKESGFKYGPSTGKVITKEDLECGYHFVYFPREHQKEKADKKEAPSFYGASAMDDETRAFQELTANESEIMSAGDLETYGASGTTAPASRVKARVCDNCKNFVAKDRYCKKLDIDDVPADKAEECFFYEYKPTLARAGGVRPKSRDWWYANEARFLSKNPRADPGYTRRIVGSIWWHKLSDERIAEKIGLWGTDEEIEAARNQGWNIPYYESKQKKAEKDRIKEEVIENLKGMEFVPGAEETIKEALRSFHKVWPSEKVEIAPPPPPAGKPKSKFCPECATAVTGWTCTKCGMKLSAPSDDNENPLGFIERR
jgi:hypothetical protein